MRACTNHLLLPNFYSMMYATSQQSATLFLSVLYCVYRFRKLLIRFLPVSLYDKMKVSKNRLFNLMMIMLSKSTSE